MDAINLIIKPDETEPGAAEVYVNGTINGRAYQFLLDTGAARTSVIADDYTSRLDSVERHDSSGVFAASSDDVVTVPDITIGPISRQNFPVVRTPADSPGTTTLVGMDLLKDFRCHFLFDESRVRVDASHTHGASYSVQDLFLDARAHPYVTVQLGTRQANAVWDTGASLTVVNMAFIHKHPALFQLAGTSTGTDATGTSLETPMFTMAEMVIGHTPFPPQRVAGVDLSRVNAAIEVPMDLILGYTTLCQANWLFDFPRRKWVISKQLATP